MIVRKRLALEYDGSSGAVFVIESGYGEAHSFSSEANWYIGTIALDHCFGIHFTFYTVYSVGSVINGHNDGFFVVLDGYGTVVVIVGNGSVERFSECADRNHGSPVAVNIWSSVHGEELLVDDILGRTDGHYNVMMSEDAAITSGVVEGSDIETLVGSIFYSNTDGNFSWFGSVNNEFTLAVGNILLNVNSYNCVVIALVFDVSIELAVDLSFFAVSLNNCYSNILFIVDRTFSWIEFKIEAVVRINNSQGLLNIDVLAAIKCGNSDRGAKEFFVGNFISSGPEGTVEEIFVNNSLAIETISYILTWSSDLDAVFVNILSGSSYELAKSYFIIENEVSVGALVMGNELHIEIGNGAKFSSVESDFYIVTAEKSYTYSVLARGEVFSCIAANISEGPMVASWDQTEIGSIESGLISSAKDIDILSMFCSEGTFSSSIPGSWFAEHFCVIAGQYIASFVSDHELNSIAEISAVVAVGPVVGVGASEYITAINGSVDVICTAGFGYNANSEFLIANSDGNRNVSLVIHGEGGFEFTITISLNSNGCILATEEQVLVSARSQSDFLIFSNAAIFLMSNTSQGVFSSAVSIPTFVTYEVDVVDFFFVVKFQSVVTSYIFTSQGDVIDSLGSWGNGYFKAITGIEFYKSICQRISHGTSIWILDCANTSIDIVNTTTFESSFKRGITIYIICDTIEVVANCGKSVGRSCEINCVCEITIFISSPDYNILKNFVIQRLIVGITKIKLYSLCIILIRINRSIITTYS